MEKFQEMILSNPCNNCADNVIAAVATYFNCDYKMIYSEAWEFDYVSRDKCSNNIGKRFGVRKSDSIKLFEDYYGIEFCMNSGVTLDALLYTLKTEIDNKRPIAIYMDIYGCPWYKPAYHKYHSNHFFLAIDYDLEKMTVFCADGKMACNVVEMSILDTYKYIECYITFKKNDIKLNNKDYYKIIRESCQAMTCIKDGENSFSKIRKFGNDILTELDIDEETKGYEYNYLKSPFYLNIVRVYNKKRDIRCITEFLWGEDFLDKGAKKVADMWNSILGLSIKLHFVKNRKALIEKISQKIILVADEEEKVVREMINFIDNYEGEKDKQINTDPIEINEKVKEIIPIDIESYCNNNGFGTLDFNKCKAEFSNGARFFVKDDSIINKKWVVDDMEFLVPTIDGIRNDNVVCDSQEIEVNKDKYKYVMILGCAEYGSHFDSMFICHEDFVEKVNVESSNWALSKPNFGEKIAWKGKTAVRNKGKIEVYPYPVFIFAKKYRLNDSSEIYKIKLPQCLNMHFFAISLGK